MIAVSRGIGESYAVFLIPLSETFSWNRANVTSIFSFYMIFFGFGSLLSGIVYDRLGPRFNYFIGLLLLAVCYGFAKYLSSVLAFYLVIGICGGVGAAMVGMVPAQSIISKWFLRGRSRAISIAYSGQGIGVMILAPAAQVIIQSSGWQFAYTLASYGFFTLFIITLLMPWKLITYGINLTSASINNKHIKKKSETLKTLNSNDLSLYQAIKRPDFWGFFTIFAASAISIFSVSLQVVVFLVEQKFSVVHAAFAFGCVGMLTILGIAITGILTELYPRHVIATISYGLTILGILALAALQLYSSWVLLGVFILSFGLSAGARGPIVTIQMAEIYAGRGLASIFGATTIGQGCGAAFGAFTAGFLYDVTGGYNLGFLMSIIFALIGLSMFWIVPEIRYGKSKF